MRQFKFFAGAIEVVEEEVNKWLQKYPGIFVEEWKTEIVSGGGDVVHALYILADVPEHKEKTDIYYEIITEGPAETAADEIEIAEAINSLALTEFDIRMIDNSETIGYGSYKAGQSEDSKELFGYICNESGRIIGLGLKIDAILANRRRGEAVRYELFISDTEDPITCRSIPALADAILINAEHGEEFEVQLLDEDNLIGTLIYKDKALENRQAQDLMEKIEGVWTHDERQTYEFRTEVPGANTVLDSTRSLFLLDQLIKDNVRPSENFTITIRKDDGDDGREVREVGEGEYRRVDSNVQYVELSEEAQATHLVNKLNYISAMRRAEAKAAPINYLLMSNHIPNEALYNTPTLSPLILHQQIKDQVRAGEMFEIVVRNQQGQEVGRGVYQMEGQEIGVFSEERKAQGLLAKLKEIEEMADE